MTVVAIVIFTVVYILIASERINRVAAALGGAGLMLALGVVGADDAFFSQDTGIDWNVIFLLFGMMVIVGVLRQTGIFEYVAIWAAKRAGGRPFRVMVLLCLITAVASAALDNVTTVLLIAPVTLLVCEQIGVRPVPFLIAEALASNIGGTATLVGDPPNLIVARSRTGRQSDAARRARSHRGPVAALALPGRPGLGPRRFQPPRRAAPRAVGGGAARRRRAGRHQRAPP